MSEIRQPDHHRWSPAEDQHLLHMNRRACSLQDMARRFGAEPQEIQDRLDWLAAEQDAEKERKLQESAAKANAVPPAQLDALFLIGTKVTKGYEMLGKDLQSLVEVLCSGLGEAELVAIIQAYLKGAGPAAMAGVNAEHMAAALLRYFTLIPKVMMQVVPATPNQSIEEDDSTESATASQNASADDVGNLRGEASP